MISIIVPTLNEETAILRTLSALVALPGLKEIVVADGGSDDRTIERARRSGVRVIECGRGRGIQMHVGAGESRGDALWFMHADTLPDGSALEDIEAALQDPNVVGGNFSVVFDGNGLSSRQMTWIYPRLRVLGLTYGDAGIFVRRSAYEALGGFRPLPLFEDLDLIGRLRTAGKFVHLETRVFTSSRRFAGSRYLLSWIVWIALQLLFWAGVSPHRLARLYRNAR